MYKKVKIISLLTGVLFAFSACNNSNKEKTSENEVIVESKSKEAPDFEVTTVEGEKISLQKSMNDGKAVVIYFTASWCPTCAKNWPALSEVYPEYQDQIDLVAISIDPTDDKEVMRKLSRDKEFAFPVTAGHPEIMLDFGVEKQATTVGVNREGYIEFKENYTALSVEEYRALFDQLLK